MSEEKNKQQIIYEAAARLFRDKGYRATSMRDLAKAVDLKASSLYNHIKSKEEILKGICFENARKFLMGMDQVEQLPVSAKEKVKALLALHIRIATEDITSVTAFNDEWRHLSGPFLEDFLKMRKAYENRFKAIIEEGIEQNEFRRIDASILLYTLLSSVRWIYDWYKPGKKINQEYLIEQVTSMLTLGISNE